MFENIYSFWELFVILIFIILITNLLKNLLDNNKYSLINFRLSIFILIITIFQLSIELVLITLIYFENLILNSEKYLFENFTLNIVYTFISILLVSIGWSIHLRTKIKKKKILRIFIFYLMALIILFSKYNFKIN
jgi:hypothetical protein|tara:strand:+ start:983 stop:1387 length:405 start_codon:yes stop_codon:yes gene_type:complete